MQYTPPPAVVRNVDEKPATPVVRGVEAESAAAEMGAMLRVTTANVKSSPELLRGALRVRDVTGEELSRRNDTQEKYYPVGVRAGEFQFKDSTLSYRLLGPRPVEQVVCKLLRCPDPDLLNARQVQNLAQVNKGSPQIQRILLDFAEKLDGGQRDTAATFDSGLSIVCLPGDSAGIVATRFGAATKAIDESKANNHQLDAIRDELEVAQLFREALHLRFVAQVEDLNLPYEASIGRRTLAVSSVEDVRRELEPVGLLQVRVQGNKFLTEQDKKTLAAIIGEVRDVQLSARLEAALAAGAVAGLEKDVGSSLRAHHAAVVYGDERAAIVKSENVAAEWSLRREEIVARSRALVVRDVAQRGEVPSTRELSHIEEQLASLTSVSDAKLALAEGVSAAKGAALLEPEGSARTNTIRQLEILEARLCAESLAELGIESPGFQVDKEKVSQLSESERRVAFDGLTRLLRDAFERHDSKTREALEVALKAFIDSEVDPAVRKVREFDALTSFAVFALEQPQILQGGSVLLRDLFVAEPGRDREVLMNYLSVKLEELRAARFVGREALEKILVGTPEYSRASREFVEVDRQFVRCITALQRGLAYDVVHAGSSEQKNVAFSKLEKLLDPSREEDLIALKDAQLERERLRGVVRALEGDPAKSRTHSLAIARGNLQLVEATVARLSDSIVWTAVYQAKVALEAQDPKLTQRALMIINGVPSEVELEPVAQRLMQAFKRDHESPQKLLALFKQFLYESVRDKPTYTYACMIALGLLGGAGAYATRRSSYLGFLLASSATLAATKALCITTGLDSMAAAYSTGLTFSTRGSAALDLFYLVSDLAQAGLLFGAYKGLKRSQQQGLLAQWPTDRKEFFRALGHEVAEYAKAGLSQLDPRNLGFYLIGIPLAVGAYHIRSSGARPEEQLAQALTLAGEVVPILLIAILHDRIMARFQSGAASEAPMSAQSDVPT